MAWTSSACLRARPSVADVVEASLKKAKHLSVGARFYVQRGQPGIFLALSVLTLGILTPLLPTSFTAAILLLTGIALAVYGAGANLAGAITATCAGTPTHDDAPVQTVAPPFASEIVAVPRVPAPHSQRSARPRRSASAHVPNHDWADLMARINHELRTPLNAVIGFSEVMALEMFGPLGNERYQDYVRHIRDSAGDLLKSAEDTLALTALLTGPRPASAPVACTLDHAVADAWAVVERKAAVRDVRLELTLPEDVEVLGEPRALRQILVNILSEGIARAEPGQSVSLRAIADCELIEIVLSAGGDQPAGLRRAGSLAICLARTLLEMQGTSLLEIETAEGGWRAVTVLDRAVQHDFFTVQAAPAREPALAL